VDRWPNVTTLEVETDGVGRDVVALLRAGSRDRPAVQAVLRTLVEHGTGPARRAWRPY
jgi:hypothetical protein